MELRKFETGELNLHKDFVGFPSIKEELYDIVTYLGYLNELARRGEHEQKRLLIQAESGSIFLGATGVGKTYAVCCIGNEVKRMGYLVVDGSAMLERKEVEPRDVKEFFEKCKSAAERGPLLIVYDDTRRLLGSKAKGAFGEIMGRGMEEIEPVFGEFRRQIDRLGDFNYPAYIIITATALLGNVDEQIARRLSRHLIFPMPSDESRKALFRYYIDKFGFDPNSFDIITFSYLTEGVVASRVEEIVSKASYKACVEGKLTNKTIVREIVRLLHGPPTDVSPTRQQKMETGYHEFGGHMLPAYVLGFDPILVSVEPSADGSLGKSVFRYSEKILPSSTKFLFGRTITYMGSTAIYQKFGMGDEGRTKDLEEAASFALNLYAFKNPIVGAGVRAMLGERSYLEQGLLSEEGRRKLEREVGRIKKTALNFARDVVEKYEDVIRTFVRDHLIRRETMVRMEIMDVLEDMGVKAACMYKRMCNELKKMGYL